MPCGSAQASRLGTHVISAPRDLRNRERVGRCGAEDPSEYGADEIEEEDSPREWFITGSKDGATGDEVIEAVCDGVVGCPARSS